VTFLGATAIAAFGAVFYFVVIRHDGFKGAMILTAWWLMDLAYRINRQEWWYVPLGIAMVAWNLRWMRQRMAEVVK
jgi:hypothetical protein